MFPFLAVQAGPLVSNLAGPITLDGVLWVIDVFNLIEFFGAAALFGWFTFARLKDDEVSKVRGVTNKAKARQNLYAISNYFLLSFLFYATAAIGDYLYWHTSHPYLDLLSREQLFVITLGFFIIGTLVLVVPFVFVTIVPRFGWKLEDVRPPPFDYTVLLFVSAAVFSMFAWTRPVGGLVPFVYHAITTAYFLSGLAPYTGLYIGTKYFWKGEHWHKWAVVSNYLLVILFPVWANVVLTSLISFAPRSWFV